MTTMNTTDQARAVACIRFVRPRVAWQCAVTKEQTSGELIGIEHPDGKRGLCLNGRGWVQYIALDKIRRLDATPWPNDEMRDRSGSGTSQENQPTKLQ